MNVLVVSFKWIFCVVCELNTWFFELRGSQVRELILVHSNSYKGIVVPLVVSVESWERNPHERVGNRQRAMG